MNARTLETQVCENGLIARLVETPDGFQLTLDGKFVHGGYDYYRTLQAFYNLVRNNRGPRP
jgi:hypothetical protein